MVACTFRLRRSVCRSDQSGCRQQAAWIRLVLAPRKHGNARSIGYVRRPLARGGAIRRVDQRRIDRRFRWDVGAVATWRRTGTTIVAGTVAGTVVEAAAVVRVARAEGIAEAVSPVLGIVAELVDTAAKPGAAQRGAVPGAAGLRRRFATMFQVGRCRRCCGSGERWTGREGKIRRRDEQSASLRIGERSRAVRPYGPGSGPLTGTAAAGGSGNQNNGNNGYGVCHSLLSLNFRVGPLSVCHGSILFLVARGHIAACPPAQPPATSPLRAEQPPDGSAYRIEVSASPSPSAAPRPPSSRLASLLPSVSSGTKSGSRYAATTGTKRRPRTMFSQGGIAAAPPLVAKHSLSEDYNRLPSQDKPISLSSEPSPTPRSPTSPPSPAARRILGTLRTHAWLWTFVLSEFGMAGKVYP